MARIFISYSRADVLFTDELVPLLNKVFPDYTVWFDEHITGGEDWWQRILKEIAACDLFIYLLSNDSLASEYCQAEFREALRLQKTCLPVIVRPKTVVATAPDDIKLEIRRRNWIDMSGGFRDYKANAALYSAIGQHLAHVPARPQPPLTPHPIVEPAITLARKRTSGRLSANQLALIVAGLGLIGALGAALISIIPPLLQQGREAAATQAAMTTATAIAQAPTDTPTLEFAQIAGTFNAQTTIEQGTLGANNTATAVATRVTPNWTPTPTNILVPLPTFTASINAFQTQEAQTATAQFYVNGTATFDAYTETATLTNTPTDTPTVMPTATPTPSDTPEPIVTNPVHLVLWHAKQDQDADALLSLIDAFQQAHPNITIEQVYNPSGTIGDSFVAAVGSGEGPDMILWANDSVGPWATAHLIADINDGVDDSFKAQATDSAWGTFTFNGGIWGVPFSAQTLAFFYNKSLVPVAPSTWADALSTAKDLHASQPGVTGLAFQNGFFHSAGFLYALGGSLMDAEGNAAFAPDNAAGRAALVTYLQFHHDMYELGQDPTSGIIVDGSAPNPGFQSGTVGMIYDGMWNLAQYESDLGQDLGVAMMPRLANGNVPALFAQTFGFFPSANLVNDPAKLAAFIEWGKYVTSPDGQTIASQQARLLPVNPNVIVADPNQQTFLEQLAYGTPFPNRAEMGAFWGPMGDAITAVSAGGVTSEAGADAAYTAIQTVIDQIHAQQS